MKIMNDETLGPILPVMAYSSINEAIFFANRTEYELGGAVFAGSEDEAMEIARKMKCGTVSINSVSLSVIPQAGEKYSFKISEMASIRNGESTLKKFLKEKSYLINRGAVIDPWFAN
jgi:aldehyde dehydrogenase (NAD+)